MAESNVAETQTELLVFLDRAQSHKQRIISPKCCNERRKPKVRAVGSAGKGSEGTHLYENAMRSSEQYLRRRDLSSYDKTPLYFAWERMQPKLKDKNVMKRQDKSIRQARDVPSHPRPSISSATAGDPSHKMTSTFTQQQQVGSNAYSDRGKKRQSDTNRLDADMDRYVQSDSKQRSSTQWYAPLHGQKGVEWKSRKGSAAHLEEEASDAILSRRNGAIQEIRSLQTRLDSRLLTLEKKAQIAKTQSNGTQVEDVKGTHGTRSLSKDRRNDRAHQDSDRKTRYSLGDKAPSNTLIGQILSDMHLQGENEGTRHSEYEEDASISTDRSSQNTTYGGYEENSQPRHGSAPQTWTEDGEGASLRTQQAASDEFSRRPRGMDTRAQKQDEYAIDASAKGFPAKRSGSKTSHASGPTRALEGWRQPLQEAHTAGRTKGHDSRAPQRDSIPENTNRENGYSEPQSDMSVRHKDSRTASDKVGRDRVSFRHTSPEPSAPNPIERNGQRSTSKYGEYKGSGSDCGSYSSVDTYSEAKLSHRIDPDEGRASSSTNMPIDSVRSNKSRQYDHERSSIREEADNDSEYEAYECQNNSTRKHTPPVDRTNFESLKTLSKKADYRNDDSSEYRDAQHRNDVAENYEMYDDKSTRNGRVLGEREDRRGFNGLERSLSDAADSYHADTDPMNEYAESYSNRAIGKKRSAEGSRSMDIRSSDRGGATEGVQEDADAHKSRDRRYSQPLDRYADEEIRQSYITSDRHSKREESLDSNRSSARKVSDSSNGKWISVLPERSGSEYDKHTFLEGVDRYDSDEERQNRYRYPKEPSSQAHEVLGREKSNGGRMASTRSNDGSIGHTMARKNVQSVENELYEDRLQRDGMHERWHEPESRAVVDRQRIESKMKASKTGPSTFCNDKNPAPDIIRERDGSEKERSDIASPDRARKQANATIHRSEERAKRTRASKRSNVGEVKDECKPLSLREAEGTSENASARTSRNDIKPISLYQTEKSNALEGDVGVARDYLKGYETELSSTQEEEPIHSDTELINDARRKQNLHKRTDNRERNRNPHNQVLPSFLPPFQNSIHTDMQSPAFSVSGHDNGQEIPIHWPPGVQSPSWKDMEIEYLKQHPLAPPGFERYVNDSHMKRYWLWLHWYSGWQLWYMQQGEAQITRNKSDLKTKHVDPNVHLPAQVVPL